MCKILGKDFERYLSVVMGPVLKTASFKPEIAVVDGIFHLYFMSILSVNGLQISFDSDYKVNKVKRDHKMYKIKKVEFSFIIKQHICNPLLCTYGKWVVLIWIEEEAKEISDEDDWQFVTIGDQVNRAELIDLWYK